MDAAVVVLVEEDERGSWSCLRRVTARSGAKDREAAAIRGGRDFRAWRIGGTSGYKEKDSPQLQVRL